MVITRVMTQGRSRHGVVTIPTTGTGSCPTGRFVRLLWQTYNRLCDAIREAEDRALSASVRMLARMAAEAGAVVP